MDEQTDDEDDKTEDLREIFMTVSEDGTVTESQEDQPSYEAVDAESGDADVEEAVVDGLDDAIAGTDAEPEAALD